MTISDFVQEEELNWNIRGHRWQNHARTLISSLREFISLNPVATLNSTEYGKYKMHA